MPGFPTRKSNSSLRASPSGRGQAVPAHVADKYHQHYPAVPPPPGMSGITGQPTIEPSMMMSKFMQSSTMNDDDIAYYAATSADPPYDVDNQVFRNSGMMLQVDLEPVGDPLEPLGDEELRLGELRRWIGLLVTEAEMLDASDEDDDEDMQDEASVAAGVAGYTAPLGTTPKVPGGKKRKPAWQAAGSAFGNAKPQNR